jgi:hypothetical protein
MINTPIKPFYMSLDLFLYDPAELELIGSLFEEKLGPLCSSGSFFHG